VGDTIARIRKLTNGFVVCATDPAIVKSNATSKGRWQNPEVEYAFKTFEEVLRWLKAQKDTLLPAPDDEEEYANSFDEATAGEK
jgi:hypothetical protein